MVRIVWTDSGLWHEQGWESKEEIVNISHGLVDVVTVGTLVHEDDDKYYVALSADNVNSAYYGIQIIGKFAVKEFATLKADVYKMTQNSGFVPSDAWDPTKESY